MKSIAGTNNFQKIRDWLFHSGYSFYIIPFVFLMLFLLSKGSPHPSGYYLIHYLYNYEKGFSPRGLVGEVISWFTDSVTDELIANINLVFSVLLVVAASCYFGKALNQTKFKEKSFSYTIATIAIICLIPASFSMFFESIHLDKMLWVLTLFAVLLSDSKFGVWFVPLLCIISVLINPIYVFGSMILIAIILLQKFCSGGFKFKNGLICFITYASIIAIALYGAYYEQSVHLFDTPSEMVDFYFSRYAGQLDSYTYNKFITEWLFEFFEPMDKVFMLCFNYYFKDWGFGQKTFFGILLLGIPVWSIFFKIWKFAIKAENNYFQKIIYFFCLVSPVVIVPVLILGWEFPRYFYENLLMQLFLVLYFIAKNHTPVIEGINNLISYFKQNILIGAATLLHFIFIIVI